MHKHNIGPGSTRWWENPTGMPEESERLSAARLSPARPTSHLFVHPPWFEDCALHIPATPWSQKSREAYLSSLQAVSQHIWILEATQEERRERPRPRNTSPAIKQELAHEVRSDARYTTIVRWLSMCTQAYFYPPTSKLPFCILKILFMIENIYANKLVTHPSLKLHFAPCFIWRSSMMIHHVQTSILSPTHVLTLS